MKFSLALWTLSLLPLLGACAPATSAALDRADTTGRVALTGLTVTLKDAETPQRSFEGETLSLIVQQPGNDSGDRVGLAQTRVGPGNAAQLTLPGRLDASLLAAATAETFSGGATSCTDDGVPITTEDVKVTVSGGFAVTARGSKTGLLNLELEPRVSSQFSENGLYLMYADRPALIMLSSTCKTDAFPLHVRTDLRLERGWNIFRGVTALASGKIEVTLTSVPKAEPLQTARLVTTDIVITSVTLK